MGFRRLRLTTAVIFSFHTELLVRNEKEKANDELWEIAWNRIVYVKLG